MSLSRLVVRSATYHWRTNLAVVLGVAAAVSVLGGALLVGDSVRGSLRDLVMSRLGKTDDVVASAGFFQEGLARGSRLSRSDIGRAAHRHTRRRHPRAVGTARHERARLRRRRALLGVSWRRDARRGVRLAGARAASSALNAGDVLLTRLQKPSDIPLESLFAHKDDVAGTVRLTATGTLPPAQLGEFALQPQQSEVRAVFAPLRRLQRDLGVADQVNTVLVAGARARMRSVRCATRSRSTTSSVTVDVGRRGTAVIVESAGGVMNEALERATREAASELGVPAVRLFTYLANSIRVRDREVPYSLITGIDLGAFPLFTRPPPPAPVAPSPPVPAGTGERPALGDAIRHQQDDAIVLNDWTARELEARSWRSRRSRVLSVGRGGRPAGPTRPISPSMRSFRSPASRPIVASRPSIRASPRPRASRTGIRRFRWTSRASGRRTSSTGATIARRRRPFSPTSGRVISGRRVTATSPDFASMAGSAGRGGAAGDALREKLRQRVAPESQGVTVTPARALALQASVGATDFGEYFTYFSFFIVVSALLLVVLFFRLGIEQRLRQIGVLRATGYTERHLRWMFSVEALVVSLLGGLLGVAGADRLRACRGLRTEDVVGRRGRDDAARAARDATQPADRVRRRRRRVARRASCCRCVPCRAAVRGRCSARIRSKSRRRRSAACSPHVPRLQRDLRGDRRSR